MHRSEAREYVTCIACDAEIGVAERAYILGDDRSLCFQCAVARHGTYDEELDAWTVPPDVEDLVAPEGESWS